MLVQCRICKRVRENGNYRLPVPSELSAAVSETYCPRCARETLAKLSPGDFIALPPPALRHMPTTPPFSLAKLGSH
jgi:hypothetical protein